MSDFNILDFNFSKNVFFVENDKKCKIGVLKEKSGQL